MNFVHIFFQPRMLRLPILMVVCSPLLVNIATSSIITLNAAAHLPLIARWLTIMILCIT